MPQYGWLLPDVKLISPVLEKFVHSTNNSLASVKRRWVGEDFAVAVCLAHLVTKANLILCTENLIIRAWSAAMACAYWSICPNIMVNMYNLDKPKIGIHRECGFGMNFTYSIWKWFPADLRRGTVQFVIRNLIASRIWSNNTMTLY